MNKNKNQIRTMIVAVHNLLLIILPCIMVFASRFSKAKIPILVPFYILFLISPTIFSIIFTFLLNRWNHVKPIIHFTISLILYSVSLFYCWYVFVWGTCFPPLVFTSTDIKDDPVFDEDSLVLDNIYFENYMNEELFPSKESIEGKKTDYFYKITPDINVAVYQIYLEVYYNEEEYQQEKERVMDLQEGIELVDSKYYEGREDYILNNAILLDNLQKGFHVELVSFSDDDLSARYVYAFAFSNRIHSLYFLEKK